MNLRPYQSVAVDRTLAAIDERPILVAPTGSGKTVMAAEIVRRFDGTILFLAHRKELIHQARARLQTFGVDSGIILAGHSPDPSKRVQVGSVQTAGRREVQSFGLTIIDESHHAVSASYAPFLSGRVLGLTATPFRTDGKPLGDIFKTLVIAAHADELLADGTLVRPRMFTTDQLPDVSGVRSVGGDYERGELSDRMRKSTITGDIVAHWFKIAANTRTMVYAVDVKHSQSIVDAFLAVGIPAEHVDGDTEDRHLIIERLVRGETKVVSNCAVYTEGTDIPELETLIIARPTKSLCLHIQIIGRVLRTSPGKTSAIILDHAGNLMRHGPISQRLDYSLDSPVKRSTTDGNKLGLRRCPSCYGLSPSGTPQCPECGHTFSSDRSPKSRDGELAEFDDLDRRKTYWEDCVGHTFGEKTTYITYAIQAYRNRYGRWPDPGPPFRDTTTPTTELKDRTFRWLARFANKHIKNHDHQTWVDGHYKRLFGTWYRGKEKEIAINEHGWKRRNWVPPWVKAN